MENMISRKILQINLKLLVIRIEILFAEVRMRIIYALMTN